MKFRKQDWDNGMELEVAVSEISQRKHIGEENVGRGTQAEGGPLKEMERNGCHG